MQISMNYQGNRTIKKNKKGYNNANAYLYLAGKKLYDYKNEIIDSKNQVFYSPIDTITFKNVA